MINCVHSHHCPCTCTHIYKQGLLSFILHLSNVYLETVPGICILEAVSKPFPIQLPSSLCLLVKSWLSLSPHKSCWADLALSAWWISVAGTELAILSISGCSARLQWGNYFWKCQFSTARDKQKKRCRLSQQGQLGLLIEDGWICLDKSV